jgi:polar amino acid transport system substrate-binding protein
MKRFRLMAISLLSIGALILAAACGASPSPTSTVGQFADAGNTVFANRCAKCHGANGQGVTAPAIIGTSASLQKYNTAQGLLNFIDTTMPFDAPGSLSHQEYLQVLCFLLVKNNFASGSVTFDENGLGSIQLK